VTRVSIKLPKDSFEGDGLPGPGYARGFAGHRGIGLAKP